MNAALPRMNRLAPLVGTLLVLAPCANLALAAAPPAPNERQAMQALFGAGYTGRGTVLSIPVPLGQQQNGAPGSPQRLTEAVKPWLTTSVTLDGVPYFIATAQGHEVTDPKDPGFAAHAQPALISAVWYALRQGRWTVAGRAYNLAEDGSFGEVNGGPWTPFPQVAVLQGNALLVAPESGSVNQGYAASWLPIYWFNQSGLKSLGSITSGGDNTGAGLPPEVAFTGRAMTASLGAAGTPQVTMSYTGKTAIGDKPVTLRNTPCTFIYRRDPKKPGPSAFTATTPQCQAIVDSASF